MKIHNEPAAPASITHDLIRQRVSNEKAAAPDRSKEDAVETSGISVKAEADPERLEQLRSAIREGKYSVPASEISARLIDEHLKAGE